MNRYSDKSSAFERAEQRLNEWGASCRENVSSLGLPTISGIARMIDHVRTQDREEKKVRRQALRKARKAWRHGDTATDSKLVAEELGYTEKGLTANGKGKGGYRELSMQVSSSDLQVDFVISKLPEWERQAVFRSYMYHQPDRNAAQDLRIPKATYRLRRIAAVEHVSRLLNGP